MVVIHYEAGTMTTWIFGKLWIPLSRCRRWNVRLLAYPSSQYLTREASQGKMRGGGRAAILCPPSSFYLFLPALIQYCIYLDAYCVQARAEVLGLRGEQSWPLPSWSFQCSVLLGVEEETTQNTITPTVITRRATNKKCGL